MIIRFVFVLLLSFHHFAQASGEGHFPTSLQGAWEGDLAITRYENAAPVIKEDFPSSSRMKLVIGNSTLIAYYLDSDTPHKPDGFLNKFDFSFTADTIAGNYFASGSDKEGRWDEAQSIVLQKVDPGALHVYWLRAVGNMDQPQEDENTRWAVIKIGTLKKTD